MFIKQIRNYSLALVSVVVSTAVSASNTINFQGEVTDQTCAVTINGNSSSPLVLLPTVSSGSLNAAGKTAGQTPFTVGLTGCTASTSSTAINTVFVGNNLNSSGRLSNTGNASNVSLQLVDPKTPTTPLDLTGKTGAAGLVLAPNTTSTSYDFAVQYYAEGVSTPGSVLGSVQYSVSYK